MITKRPDFFFKTQSTTLKEKKKKKKTIKMSQRHLLSKKREMATLLWKSLHHWNPTATFQSWVGVKRDCLVWISALSSCSRMNTPDKVCIWTIPHLNNRVHEHFLSFLPAEFTVPSANPLTLGRHWVNCVGTVLWIRTSINVNRVLHTAYRGWNCH